jgi:hypothetical protein
MSSIAAFGIPLDDDGLDRVSAVLWTVEGIGHLARFTTEQMAYSTGLASYRNRYHVTQVVLAQNFENRLGAEAFV